MKRIYILLSLSLLPGMAMADGYYYPVPVNPPAIQYVLPPAYIAPPQNYYPPPPVGIQPIQRGYMEPPPAGWTDSKIIPLPPKIDLSPKN